MNKGAIIREVEISAIEVLNPRERNQKVFQELVESIRLLGLKKPITVAERSGPDGPRYVLVCGQGRMEAFQALGQVAIPAQVIEATDDEAFVMSLVENIARHTPRTVEMLNLLEKGEQRLLTAVEAGRMPMAVAIAIARVGDNDGEIQEVMQGAYEQGTLRGQKLMTVKRLIEDRRRLGKGAERAGRASKGTHKLSSHALVRAYSREVERQKMLIRKADGVQQRLAFISGAMARLLADEDFVNLLRAEGLTSMPAMLDPGKSGGDLR